MLGLGLLFGNSFDPATDLLDLTGKVIFISGANTGIGYHSAKLLARRGAKVYVGARNEAKGKAAVEALQAEGIGHGQVIYHECDISTPHQAKSSALEFLKREDRLDILGERFSKPECIMRAERLIYSVLNYIGVFVFTNTLLPLIEKTAKEPDSDVRVVIVSSKAHTMGPTPNPNIRFNNLDQFKNTYEKESIPYFARYCISKLALTTYSHALQRRLPSNVICVTLNPGLVHTSVGNHVKYARLANLALWLFAKRPEEGSFTTLFAAASPKVKAEAEKYKATFLMPVGVISNPSPHVLKHDMQEDLWATTEKYLADIGL
ncbi:hypothetical protein CVT24_001434 [Panaeolus cyanescens]|uniref:NAD(P)-binding protein n=1 Tax=Panaeolus cyanescens TaxID=181874 RepID=A0A409W389_9AGAR|nr:hypothetical protein CVT24_001434 [Panaeolus cyanescens]